jgi:FKBP-type peptidyl-prolyl cis-trans isomerase
MKTIKYLFLFVLVLNFSCGKKQVYAEKPIQTEMDSVSYSLGLDMGLKLSQNLPELEKEQFLEGFLNGIDSTNLKIEAKLVGKIIGDYSQKKRKADFEKREKEYKEKMEKEFAHVIKAGEKFLKENKSKEGVVTTKSGLQYMVLKEGTGKQPKASDKVVVRYEGKTMNGDVFDSNFKKEKPTEFYANRVIKGWTEGLQLMKEGSKYKFFIPQELAYGINPPGAGNGHIKPFMPLVFEVELIEVKETKN